MKSISDPNFYHFRSKKPRAGNSPTYLLTNGEGFYACFYLTFRNDAIRNRLLEMYRMIREGFAGAIKEFAEEAGVEIADPDRTADLLVALSEGPSISERMRDNKQRPEEFRSYVIEQTMALLTTNGGKLP